MFGRVDSVVGIVSRRGFVGWKLDLFEGGRCCGRVGIFFLIRFCGCGFFVDFFLVRRLYM